MGVGRMKGNTVDQFTLHRQVKYPELIFNQNRSKDKLFEVDAGLNWSVAQDNGCYVCNKHTYVGIFYEQSLEAKNEGLIEIKDPEMI